MPDTNSIPFKQADPNGHYRSKQLPNDSGDFMLMLGLPEFAGDVVGPGASTANQVAVFGDATGKNLEATTQTGLADLHNGVLFTKAAPNSTIVGTTDTQVLENKTLINPTITGLTGLTKADVGLANVDNTSDANKPVSTAQAAADALKEDKNKKGVANGYASLDASIKVPLAQIPDAIVGASQYQGTWNAATNTPAIPAAAVGNKGWYYVVNVAGSTSINGINVWAVGDQIISNGSVWQKIPNVQAVNSVNGQTGTVVLTKTDVGLGNVDNTSDASKPVSSATTTALNLKEDKANKGVANGYASLDASGKVPAAQAPADLVTSVAGKQGVVVLDKADVGLANVDNTSDAVKNATAATLTNKTINGANNTLTVRLDADVVNNLPVTRLNSGTGANSGSFWRGDGQWAPTSGSGDIQGPTASVDGELPLYSGTTGKIIKRCNVSGFVKAVANGAVTTQTTMGAVDIADGAVGSSELASNSVTNVHLDVSAITAQTEKTSAVAADDKFLLVDVATGLYRYIRGSRVTNLPMNWLAGLTVSNGTDTVNDINIAPGECRDDTNSADITISSTLTKRLDAAWAAGTNQGGLDTGAVADITYHLFVIRNPTTGVCDALFSGNLASPTMPSGFTQKRRISSHVRWLSRYSGLAAFKQFGDYFQLSVINPESASAVGGVNAVLLAALPLGIKWLTHVNITVSSTTGITYARISDPDHNDSSNMLISPAANAAVGCSAMVVCSTARNVNWSIPVNGGGGTCSLTVCVIGWWDTRGKDR